MDGTASTRSFGGYSSPWRNLAWSFRKSRDNWKQKQQELKREHKRLQNQLADVRKSRSHWQQVTEEVRLELQALQQENARLKTDLAASNAALEKKG